MDRGHMLDELEAVILDTHDLDVTDRCYAKAVLRWIERNTPAIRNAALEEAAAICTGDEERPEKLSGAAFRRMTPQEQFAHEMRCLAWKDADAILALRSDLTAEGEG